MNQLRSWLFLGGCSLALSLTNIVFSIAPAHAVSLVNSVTIPADTPDLYPLNGSSGGANINRLGMFSDLYYDRHNQVYYGLSDRGPGGGVIDYQTRVQKFSLDVDPTTGGISNFNLLETILFTKDGENFNGLNPERLNGDTSKLGLSFDSEGFVVAPNGNFYVSDEYGPSVNEFRPDGSFVRSFQTPANLLSRASDGTLDYVGDRDVITSGRQDNRGFEGLAMSPDGSKLFAMLQDPLVNEGTNNDGRRSRNLRIVEFDTKSGQSTAQYIYQLESFAEINDRIPGTEDDFSATNQGRSIGISAIAAINELEFLVLERDNRGLGVEDPTASAPVGSKRVYKINLAQATNVSNLSLAGTNNLPSGVNPVSKSLFLDVADALTQTGQVLPEKLEGLTIGPKLADGSHSILLGTDNDYSVTQNDSDVQFDVCTNGTTATEVAIDSACPDGQQLIPGFLYSFRAKADELGDFISPQKTPEPTVLGGLLLVGLASLSLKRRYSSKM
ncbi:esterase-like activity of phytase family protein [Candidatus Gracilibacteria bacterium]|nr:esterase-like activity of phytase family protein [Candidatus Gracilibacteria bacterium]NJM86656.1 esterase-like activity of phytase family protein [Hydrococcus sp. RU_2_2]NJP22273.1 esterase-like activity of phytase family protein [Hydrococcus sp. CRU_1_1]NJQ98829.1 esterase-like activity of phytase family protein [Hydrococcus sp. CSU_1_8]